MHNRTRISNPPPREIVLHFMVFLNLCDVQSIYLFFAVFDDKSDL